MVKKPLSQTVITVYQIKNKSLFDDTKQKVKVNIPPKDKQTEITYLKLYLSISTPQTNFDKAPSIAEIKITSSKKWSSLIF